MNFQTKENSGVALPTSTNSPAYCLQQNENGMHSLNVKTKRPPYSWEKKNKYAVGTDGWFFECFVELKMIARKKSKLVCKLLVSEELNGGRLLLRLVPSSVLLCGLLGRKKQAGMTPSPIPDGVGKQNVLHQTFMIAVEPRTSCLSL